LASTALDQRPKRHARSLARGHERGERRRRQWFDGRDASFGSARVCRFALDADKASAEAACDGAGGAGAAKRIEHEIVRARRR
jgi:hypothetical protein